LIVPVVHIKQGEFPVEKVQQKTYVPEKKKDLIKEKIESSLKQKITDSDYLKTERFAELRYKESQIGKKTIQRICILYKDGKELSYIVHYINSRSGCISSVNLADVYTVLYHCEKQGLVKQRKNFLKFELKISQFPVVYKHWKSGMKQRDIVDVCHDVAKAPKNAIEKVVRALYIRHLDTKKSLEIDTEEAAKKLLTKATQMMIDGRHAFVIFTDQIPSGILSKFIDRSELDNHETADGIISDAIEDFKSNVLPGESINSNDTSYDISDEEKQLRYEKRLQAAERRHGMKLPTNVDLDRFEKEGVIQVLGYAPNEVLPTGSIPIPLYISETEDKTDIKKLVRELNEQDSDDSGDLNSSVPDYSEQIPEEEIIADIEEEFSPLFPLETVDEPTEVEKASGTKKSSFNIDDIL
jgi:hypothetical protein